MSDNAVVNHDRERRERQARELQQKQQAASNQEAWDAYVDARIARYLDLNRAEVSQQSYDLLPDALHEALGQVLAEERRQWRRERELIQSEASKTIAELRATIAELKNEIRQEVKPGVPGTPGVAGPPGPAGPSGKLPLVKAWESGRIFYEGDVVVHGGSTFQALHDTGNSVTHSDWICLARSGRDGRDGATPEIRGTFDANEVYKKLDVVVSDGAAFIAKYDNPGICPSDGWQLMSRQGRQGKPGKDGERGPRGEKGDTGPPAVVPQLIGSRISEDYELVLVYSDNTKEIVPLRPAFERYHAEVGE